MNIDQDKALEYMQVAALLNDEWELLRTILENPDLTVEKVRKHIDIILARKDKAISDAKFRQDRYGAMAMLYSIGK